MENIETLNSLISLVVFKCHIATQIVFYLKMTSMWVASFYQNRAVNRYEVEMWGGCFESANIKT